MIKSRELRFKYHNKYLNYIKIHEMQYNKTNKKKLAQVL